MKETISKIISSELKQPEKEILNLIEIPPNPKMGDFAFPCFSLAKTIKKNPVEIAKELSKKINKKLPKEVKEVKSVGAYLNFFINKNNLAEIFLKNVFEKDFGESNFGNKKIMVEFPSPNTNKPLHLGHLRNMAIGESVSRIIEYTGSKVIRANLNNDRGVHICKSMVAYDEFGEGETPEEKKVKSDHFVGNYYVIFSKKAKENPEYENKAQDYLRKWEAGDKKIIQLWKKMNKWALNGFKETYKLFNIKHDKQYFESEIYNKGKEVVELGLEKKIFKKRADGAIVIDLKKEGLGEKVILRADGTSIYITQDLYLAKLKYDEFNLDGSIYVVGNEQNFHFNVLFSILKKFGFKFSNKLHHLSYGMVELPEGRMKSREGTVVDADDFIHEIEGLSRAEIQARNSELPKDELEKRAHLVALAAIKYMLLKIDFKKNMIFNPKESISFEGDTGPYLLYSYARANSILKKITKKIKKIKIPELKEPEIKLIKKINEFPDVVKKSFEQLAPNVIANYSFELSQIFNEFYHACPVIGSKEESFRLKLVDGFRIVLGKSLRLLGIETLEEM